MKRFCLMMIVLLVAQSCVKSSDGDGDDALSGLRGDPYVGELTILGGVQEDIIFYIYESDDMVDILMPGVSFMPSLMPNLDMALVSNPLVSSDPDTYYLDMSQMVVIWDGLPLINDVLKSVSNINVVMGDDDSVTVTFDCAISTSVMGDIDVAILYEGRK